MASLLMSCLGTGRQSFVFAWQAAVRAVSNREHFFICGRTQCVVDDQPIDPIGLKPIEIFKQVRRLDAR
ncbi:hypothetical protein, partial [Mesorhizobium sp. M1D.F.Ca.ET.183.01.1.1]|uniref:hypothetical protein n=1 Tax=Mesorhizobium sp. M1D.F.Ca.ET.183.01.1.1 TaxID=2496666 RepID=UPI001FDF78D7